MWSSTVLVVGGTGVFGSRLARGLLDDGLDVVVAGRGEATLAAFQARHGGRPGVRTARLDRDAPGLAEAVAALSPGVVIDAAGPFQAPATHALARAALAAGAHYLDLSDDAAFTAGIAALDAEARERGLACLSGASSVPALSSAAADALARGLGRPDLIESVILPGNRAPRGLSVVRAILAQAGQPIAGPGVVAWSRPRRESLPAQPPLRRWSSPIGAPDLLLFPARYGARAVAFRAGLELALLHWGLWLLALPVRWGLAPSLAPLARPLRAAASLLERWGTDRGGMEVRVLGPDAGGRPLRRAWSLVAEAGCGPEVPTLAARALVPRLLRGEVVPGARPCLGELSLAEVEAAARGLPIAFARTEASDPPLLARALGPAWDVLPAAVRDLHAVAHERRWKGQASVVRGRSPLARLVAALMRFPPEGEGVPVTVTMRRRGEVDTWTRDFASRRFRSTLSLAGAPGAGRIVERFGPLRFEIRLAASPGGLGFPVARGAALGLPLPVLPRSDALETDQGGRAAFDVALSLPLAGLVVRYRGTLADADPPLAPSPLPRREAAR